MGTDGTGWLPFLLQTSDPLFPTGAYAHSLGLEELARLGVVRDEATLLDFFRAQVIPALAHFELPHLRLAHAAAREGDVAALCELDREISAWKVAREARDASAQLGSRRLRALLQIDPCELLQRCEAELPWKHHVVIYGAQMRDIPLDAALAAYFYLALSGYCVAALKLIRIGQEGCQRALRAALAFAPRAIADSMEIPPGEAGWFNPLLDIASMRHEHANERLFIS
ncbi:MAG TPA: urease accessory UreF family protein [Chthoniobacteraceae bacterium]|nr:urease accessory UreF family protein [Chthoniobacteraceae bacterium]